MSRLNQDADPHQRFRPRSNTNSFASFTWRRGKPDPPTAQITGVPANSPPLSLDELIKALTPPAVPSITHARSLASSFSTETPLPRLALLNPVLASLCASDSPASLQCAGYDILSAYWENNDAMPLSTADRLAYFSLFLGPTSTSWTPELWEARFKSLRALTKWGTEIVGIEASFMNVLKSWIEGAFEGLAAGNALFEHERVERERSVDILSAFLASIVENPELVARIPEDELADLLRFYTRLVIRSFPTDLTANELLSTISPPLTDLSSSSRPIQTHRRHPSSLSITSQAAPIQSPAPPKHPMDIAITLYLAHLSSQLKALSPVHLSIILPLLFRALAFYASPLPRLAVMALSHISQTSSTEDRITQTLDSLFSGPYSAFCMKILKELVLPPSSEAIQASIQTSIGAHRTLRNHIRKSLCARLARAYISRESSFGYSHTGAPERDLMERAWPKDDASGWDAGRLGRVLCNSVEAWVALDLDLMVSGGVREKILDEAGGTLKDVLQELDARDENVTLDEEEASAVGETLHHLATYILPLKNPDGCPFIVPLSHPTDAPTPFLLTLSSLLARDQTTYMNPLLSTTLLLIADHLTDADTARVPIIMSEQQDLSPTSPEWLNNWDAVLGNPLLLSHSRPLTRRAVMTSLQSVYNSVKDMPGYRKPLANLVYEYCERRVFRETSYSGGIETMWGILGDEVVLCAVDVAVDASNTMESFIELLATVASDGEHQDDDDTASVATADTHSPSPQTSFSTPSPTIVSPILSRVQSDYQSGKDSQTMPSVMSILSSLATGNSSRSQSSQPQVSEENVFDIPNDVPLHAEAPSLPHSVGAIMALIAIFTQLAFTPYALSECNVELAARIFGILLHVLLEGKCARTKLVALQFTMGLRADRDHRLYFIDPTYDPDGHILYLASLIHRAPSSSPFTRDEEGSELLEFCIARTRAAQETDRDGRRASRGRGGRPSNSAASRSHSRVALHLLPPTLHSKPCEPIWRLPECLPFSISEVNTPSETLVSYDPLGPSKRLVLPVSDYLMVIAGLLDKEQNWEILSYVLCHLPVQLANKHLFCGPKSRVFIAKILSVLCTGILTGELASDVDRWPHGLKARDAHGLAYHTLSVLISYHRCFDVHLRHVLLEVFQAGLNAQPSTIKCCLHALSLSAFELPSSMTKCLPRVLEKLSQIMSNADMAVHILNFLSITGSLPSLHANFTEADFKMVFGVALQYLQHHNRLGSSPTSSWALSQHVRILSYYIVYVWFLAVRLPDRPRHIRYITRQLLSANEGRDEVDEPTEVCFDWLARYTYASADPRPANSLLGNIVMNPNVHGPSSEVSINEKTWILGNSVVTIRALAKLGWIEVVSRRPSGFTKFLCRVENVPLVGPGDVDADMLSGPASLLMARDPPQVQPTPPLDDTLEESRTSEVSWLLSHVFNLDTIYQGSISDVFAIGSDVEDKPPPPDPITGYVWSGSAPSQRRKEVAVDPAFFALQLSSYPDYLGAPHVRPVVDPTTLPSFFRILDRMPVIDTHKVGILYVAPGQISEVEILRNTHGSPAYTRFLEGIGRLTNLRGQVDVYAGGLNPDEDGEYAYAWWDDIGQILYHTATMMPSNADDKYSVKKKRHIGNDYVRIVWNDSGRPYHFDTLATQFQFVNIVIEPHSLGAIAAFSNNIHENEYFKVTVQRAPGLTEFTPVGEFKLISAENLPLLVRQLSLLADWFASIYERTQNDTVRVEMTTNWHARLQAIRRFRKQTPVVDVQEPVEGVMGQEALRDFTTAY